jgi:protein TonB
MVKAPHARLEKEALRVIEALPKMTPGKQHLKPVKVKYTLPIIFEVH